MFLGIDIGTSGVKAVVMDTHGGGVGQGVAALSVQRPQPLWSEQDPADWWAATTAAVQAIDPAIRRAVRGIGIAGQMHGATLLGEDDRPLRPAILWNDGRSFAECEALEREMPRLREIAGNIAMPGFTAPKLRWVREHEPAVFAATRTILLPKDYVRLLMTGEKASDMSDSAGTLWMDVARRAWSDELLQACSLTTDHMPALVEGSAISGHLRAEVAELWGMDRVPVAGGGGDNAAGAAGIGVVTDGKALLSLGTSGVIFVANDRFTPNPARAVHAFCHCLPEMWHQMSVHLSAASCIDWVAKLTGAAELYVFSQGHGHIEGKGDGLEDLQRGFIQKFDEQQLLPAGEHEEERGETQGVGRHRSADPGIRSVPPDSDAGLELAAGQRQVLAQGEGPRSSRPQHPAEHGPLVQG